MKDYTINVTAEIIFNLSVEARNEKEAKEKAREMLLDNFIDKDCSFSNINNEELNATMCSCSIEDVLEDD